MRNWIANLFRRRTPSEIERSYPCLFSEAEGDVRVDILEVPLPCGHTGRLIRGEFFVQEYAKWLRVIDLRDYNAEAALWLLRKAITFLAKLDACPVLNGKINIKKPRDLPTVVLYGKRYYIDEWAEELTNVDDPQDRFQFRAV